MKKIYLLAALAAIFPTLVSANNYATKLENTQVYYLTNDTITIKEAMVENEDTGEEELQKIETFWMGLNLTPAYDAVGLPLSQASATKTNYIVRTRKNYTDAETGFSMPAGFYRGIFVDGKAMSLSGYDAKQDYMVGFQNAKAIVLYFVPIPNAWKSDQSINHADYPTGRVQARYMSLENTGDAVGGTAISNQAYREIHIDINADPKENDDRNFKGTKVCGFTRDEENPLHITIDQVYKVKVNLDNQLDGSAYENLFASDKGADWEVYNGVKKSEFVNLMCETDGYESEMSYYFADVNTTRPYTKSATYSSCATGYDCYENKWGVKLPWSAETIIQLEIKYRMYLAGYAIICADEGATTKFLNTSEKASATWKDNAQAYGNYADEITDAIDETRLNVTEKSSRIYDLSGKENNADKGMNVQNGKVVFVK